MRLLVKAITATFLSYWAHAVNQFPYFNSCYTGFNIRHAIGNDQVAIVENSAAGINHIGNIPLSFFLKRCK